MRNCGNNFIYLVTTHGACQGYGCKNHHLCKIHCIIKQDASCDFVEIFGFNTDVIGSRRRSAFQVNVGWWQSYFYRICHEKTGERPKMIEILQSPTRSPSTSRATAANCRPGTGWLRMMISFTLICKNKTSR